MREYTTLSRNASCRAVHGPSANALSSAHFQISAGLELYRHLCTLTVAWISVPAWDAYTVQYHTGLTLTIAQQVLGINVLLLLVNVRLRSAFWCTAKNGMLVIMWKESSPENDTIGIASAAIHALLA